VCKEIQIEEESEKVQQRPEADPMSIFKRAGLCVATVLVLLALGVSCASAAEPWWQVSSSAVPTVLPSAREAGGKIIPGTGQVVVRVMNQGDLQVVGSTTPVSITDVLPPGVRATGYARIFAGYAEGNREHGGMACSSTPATVVTCTWSEPSALSPYELLEVAIDVEVGPGAVTGAENEVRVSGGEGYVCEKRAGGAFATPFCNGSSNYPRTGSFEAHLTGQGVAPVAVKRPVTVGAGPTPFGVEEYTLQDQNEGGSLDTQAGSHPFGLTTNITINQIAEQETEKPRTLVKDLHFQWPPGLIGNPIPLPQCTATQFFTYNEGGSNECPADTAVGVASVTFSAPPPVDLLTEEVPVFNLVPNRGEPARFAFEVERVVVTIDPSVRTGGDYGVTVNVSNISQVIAYISSRVTVWGVPGDPIHDNERGWGCMEDGFIASQSSGVVPPCTPEVQKNPSPFLTLPTSCTGPLQTSVEADSWQEPNNVLTYGPSEPMPALDGCNKLPFSASLEVAPDVQQASTPTGLAVKVHVPQEVSLNSEALAAADVRETTVTLPEGVNINPAGANGLEACSEGLIGFTGFSELEAGTQTPTFTPKLPGTFGSPTGEKLEQGVNFCPDASKIGTVKIGVPILAHPLEGAVYLAAQNSNPFGSLVAMYIVAEDPVSGVLVKLPGEVKINPATGQIVSTFKDTPQAPFEDFELHFFGGERAPLAMPSHCGTYTTQASFTPWSGNPPVNTSSSFNITAGPDGGSCPGVSLPFSPTLTGGALNLQAGAFSPFTLTMSRKDGEQNMQSAEAHLPPGVSGILSNIELCPEPQANLGECAPNSLIGETTISVGVGGDPYAVSDGKFYLTGPYNGSGSCTVGQPGCAPFGITFEVPAKAGPYDLKRNTQNPAGENACDCVLVRGKIEINPITAAITITSNPPGTPDSIPTSIEGIPLEIQHINATTTRGDFQFNPTNCSKMEVTGTIHSSENSTDTLSVPFQVTNCAVLKFEPKLSISTSGKTSRANGASLHVHLTYPAGSFGKDANIAKVKVDLPKQLPSRLTTLQKACPAATFQADPANCPADSRVGQGKAITPLIPVPLEGPAYFVSYGGAKFPELIIVLQGYGVTIDLHGETFINKAGITSSTFHTVPDQPVGSFELTLPQGSDSALAANGDLCTSKLEMPTVFVAQNGAEIHENTPIGVTGCAKVKTLTRAQKLAAALKACKKKAKGKRAACEAATRKKYGPVKKAKKK
jgi:hypothetical protein